MSLLCKVFLAGCIGVAMIGMAAPSQAQQVLRCATQDNNPPNSWFDKTSNGWKGFFIETADAVGTSVGFSCQYQDFLLANLIPALTSNQADLIAANLTETLERRQSVDFTKPYARFGGDALVVSKSDTTSYTSMADFKGKSVGVVAGTVFADLMKKVGIEPKLYAAPDDVFNAANRGDIIAAIVYGPTAIYRVKQNGEFPNIRYVDTYKSAVVSNIAFVVRKDEAELNGKIDAAITKLEENGTLKSIRAKYGLE